ncbi:MFS transporter [Hathewaya histolytica]|uniref:Major facilitator family transporter n=1 Tax=Hathewaya histolytica TaxID=1498 RepID=A0A4U9RI56_HATHI|nr:MFS transporter [Hathewaya histolytica]VTQ90966.1 major facilitator family transporter [Hathewaya histolytica]
MSAIKSYVSDIKNSSKDAKLFLIAYFLWAVQGGSYWTAYMVIVQESFGTVQLGTMMAVSTLFSALSAIPIGILNKKFGFKKMMIFGAIFNTLFMVVTLYTKSFVLLLVFTALQGPPAAATDVLSAPLINATTTEKQRSTIYSMMFAGYWCIVAIVSKLSGNLIVGIQNSMNIPELTAYKYFFVLTCAISLISIIPLLMLSNIKLEVAEKKEKKSFGESFKEVANKDVLIYLIYVGLIGLGLGLFTPFFSNFFKNGLKLDPKTIGNVISVQYFAMVIGMLLCPFFEKKFGRIVTLGVSSLLSIPFMLIIANCDKFGGAMVPVLTVAFFMRSGLMNLNMPIMFTIIMEFVEPDKRATVSGLQSTFRTGLSSISSGVAGVVMSIPAFSVLGLTMDGYRVPYYIAGALYFIAQVILFKVFYKKYNRPVAKENLEEVAAS